MLTNANRRGRKRHCTNSISSSYSHHATLPRSSTTVVSYTLIQLMMDRRLRTFFQVHASLNAVSRPNNVKRFDAVVESDVVHKLGDGLTSPNLGRLQV